MGPTKSMGGCFSSKTAMSSTKEAIKLLETKQGEYLEAMKALCALGNKFNGLIDPAQSWKHNDISHGVTKYLDDMDQIAEDRIRRGGIVWKDVTRKLRRVEEACK